MKKIIFILIAILVGLIGYGQSDDKPIFDDGYYYGVVNDSLSNKYIFMSFLSNDGDDKVYIVPYIQDTIFMHKDFIKSLENIEQDSIDGNIYVDKCWTIPGFDNYSYYTMDGNHIQFSLNIANVNSPILDVFKFDGKFSHNGKNIEAKISSTDSTFNLSVVILIYKKFEE
jgi:hypothetical protein